MSTDRKENVAVSKYLRQLFSAAAVGPTDGTETLQSSGVFTGGIYGFALPASGRPTPATRATVHEMIENGMYTKIFGSSGEHRPRWQNQGQVADFCRHHRNKLRGNDYGALFELEGGFVVNVYFSAYGQLSAFVFPFGFERIWCAERRPRFVLPLDPQ